MRDGKRNFAPDFHGVPAPQFLPYMKIRRVAVWLVLGVASSLFATTRNSVAQTSKPSTDSTAVQNQQPTPNLSPLNAATASGQTTSDPGEDTSAEAALLESINHSRSQSGAKPLRMDDSLRIAARAHARLMVNNHQLEHNFPGEPSLLQRIANASPLALDRAGENIAVATCPNDAAEMLFQSPPHRKNLLNPKFNVAGIVAIWSRGHLYVVQDFAHEVRSYTPRETGKLVVGAIEDLRRDDSLPQLTQRPMASLDNSACQLATQARPNARLLAATYTNRKIIAYTQSQPDLLPRRASRLLADPSLRQFAVGSCYARNSAYPTGIYWIAVLLN
ncbi:MAG TPA: CAP domain-containing protein [Terriglobales bacterium]|nr:CAP domain-containing protein [Terriglobales bacterium]